MMFHELATNALKYGASSAPDGELQVQWSLEEGLGTARISYAGGVKRVALGSRRRREKGTTPN
ncbi:hypothetical protein Rhsp01_43490 [Rhizobium sp. NBRC 114257]|uniref:Sensor histidine kinase n=1 Tax=Rhizobium dioscoreae TaxID=2653122 RepID=A0ABQ0ZA30_9HYPH|nr:hypothetical protein RsS93_47220 [Rhizobium dioscoreae]GLU83173.1 hypothetical protein Rhsp01_43490 [Rhizobium sp. NBRC 114257]